MIWNHKRFSILIIGATCLFGCGRESQNKGANELTSVSFAQGTRAGILPGKPPKIGAPPLVKKSPLPPALSPKDPIKAVIPNCTKPYSPWQKVGNEIVRPQGSVSYNPVTREFISPRCKIVYPK